MATIRDVARRAGVSSSTVSLTFSDASRVSAETAKKVRSAAVALGYRPNPLAQGLKRGRSRMIGMVVGDLSNPFFGSLLKEVERLAKRSNYNIIVAESEADQAQELAVLSHLADQRIAGCLLFPHGRGAAYVETLNEFDLPIVTLDHKVEGGAFDFVCSDNRIATSMLTEHLLRLGHRRITHLSGPAHFWTGAERIKGFEHTMRSAGFTDFDIVDGGYMADPAYAETMRLMTRSERPTAIVAANNVMALGCLAAIKDLGVRCPEDVSLAAIDNVPWNSVIDPQLTLVEQDLSRLARIATSYLLERIENPDIDAYPPRETVLTPRLVVGTSTKRYGS
ncbi:LacI family transcriptional regulator [Rhodobacteraceae bacterium]|nr:LacI family transcriptional regulator [Paracoccaceae bacterium]